jgi:hypothetical protein
VGHNNIHKNKVELINAVVDFVNGLKTIPLLNVSRGYTRLKRNPDAYGGLDTTLERLQEFRSYACADLVVLDE